ncbi:MAG: peptide ABC transporter substrate-binding protein, partial [Pseudomonadales bacterium]|nr:peptide ABC transporter substrate-binding protein [Pseudomonadales bacterium]
MPSSCRILILGFLGILPLFLQAAAVDFERQAITIALTQEPPNLDSTRTTDLVSFFVLGHVNEGLLGYDRRGRLTAGVAESWEMNEERMVFRLRDNARWSDGSPVTAHDFVYAWRLINDPANAAPYAAIMYPVKNAEAIQNGEMPIAELGVSATSDRDLVVELEAPCGYCLNLMVHAAFFPVKAAFHRAQGETYGAEANNLLYNGPFLISRWVHGSNLLMKKNPHYWDADEIALNEIDVGYITEDNRTRLNLFRDNSIALARLGAETVSDALDQGLRLRTFVSGGMAYIRFNVREGRLTSHADIRKAMQLVFDPETFVNKVIAIPGYKPAYSFFPSWIKGVEDKFIREYPPRKVGTNVEKARQLIEGVRREMGVDKLPPITLLTVTSPTGAKIAEYFQGLFGELGLEVK